MTLTNRQRGDYFERQVRETLVTHGYVVVRSAGSKGVCDLIALRADKTPALIQCKLSGRIDPAERAALLEAAEAAGARAMVAMRPRGGRVLLATVIHASRHLIPHETLPVPPRTKAVST